MKEYLFVSSFKVIRSSNNMEVTKQKMQSTFSETTVLQRVDKAVCFASFCFFANLTM